MGPLQEDRGDLSFLGKRKTFVDEVRSDVDDVVQLVMHRIQFGSPPLLAPTEDTGVSPMVSMTQKQKRIQRRRDLLGLPYEPWMSRP